MSPRQFLFDIGPQQHRELAEFLRELGVAADGHVAALDDFFRDAARERRQAHQTTGDLGVRLALGRDRPWSVSASVPSDSQSSRQPRPCASIRTAFPFSDSHSSCARGLRGRLRLSRFSMAWVSMSSDQSRRQGGLPESLPSI